jgi:hypothetical protein
MIPNKHKSMKNIIFSIGLLLAVIVTHAQPRILSPSEIYREVVKSTVTIVTDAGSQGSGFYVAPNVIATNYHVVEGATSVKCVLTNTTKQVDVTGYVAVDKSADLILLKVTGSPQTPLKMAHGNVATGQIIYAIGAPQGMSGTISDGIVSAVRKLEHLTVVQITAPISAGSSGGPVVNRIGEVVGISTLIHRGGQNLNFAIDYSHLQNLMGKMTYSPARLASLGGQAATQTRTASTPSTHGKVIKLRSTACSLRHKINEYKWGDWDDWEEANVLITIDTDEDRITIYSSERQVYDIAENEGESTDEDGDETLSLYCVDQDGIRCGVRLVFLNSRNGDIHLYVDYNDVSWVYDVYALE